MTEATKSLPATIIDKGNHQGTKGDGRMLPRELLDEAQGSFLLNVEISDSSGDKKHPPGSTIRADFFREHAKHVLLRPPHHQSYGQNYNRGNKKQTAETK
jgi:hypothetical protein